MNKKRMIVALMLIVLGVTLLSVACAQEPVEVTVPVEVTRLVKVKETVEVPVEVTRVVEVVITPEPGVEVPFEELWASSGHADAQAEAFRHWDEDDPKVVPVACARCHTPSGYLDYLGADGSEFGVVDSEQPVSQGIPCVACHNEVTASLDQVTMPSGVVLTGLGDESRCMVCHQGRHSTVSVNAKLEEVGLEDDQVGEELGFLNIHYYAAAATKYGTVAKGGYEYEGKSYDAYFAHVEGFTTCIGCHDSHTLEVKVESCQACHTEVESVEDFKNVRMAGSLVDYDGDGDMSEGIYDEIAGLQEVLYAAIQDYAARVAGTPIVYDAHSYPYFFIDDGNGQVDEGEAIYPNKYASWTPRLLKAAYNYQVSQKDPGAFAHGGKYIIQLLYDSIEDLNPELVAGLRRIDHGHFAGSEEAFRHWDEDGAVSSRCSKCHSAGGLPLFLQEGVTISQPVANGFQCTTCHNDLSSFSRYEVTSVTFPSGMTVDSGDANTNLCMNCHQGRASKFSVDAATAGLEPDAVAENLRFLNIHYFAAGATRFGSDVKGAYEYDGQDYVGLNLHVPAADSCTECHSAHQLVVQVDKCAECHEGADTMEALAAIRSPDTPDYDGDGDTGEGLAGEIETLRAALYDAIREYAAGIDGAAPIIYDAHSYPYFFVDSNANGVSDPGEAIYPNRYATWTPRLLQAAYNYQYATKDPGGFAHNGKYIVQILYDSLKDLGADVSGMTRP